MVSFAFNTMIGQVTPIAIAAVGWRFYVVFVRIADIHPGNEQILT